MFREITSIDEIPPFTNHPVKESIMAAYVLARRQYADYKCPVKNSNFKAKVVKANLSPEQAYVFGFIKYVFTILNVPLEVFARNIGVSPQTVRVYFRQDGHFPALTTFRRILAIYETNIHDVQALRILHGEKFRAIRREQRAAEQEAEQAEREYEQEESIQAET